MFRIDDINKCMKKLNTPVKEGKKIPGEIEYIENRGKENRFVYRYKGKTVFSFGVTRGSNKKETLLYYVPKQMGLTTPEYRKLYECPMSKEDYNSLMSQRGNL